jgi:thymidylate synthase
MSTEHTQKPPIRPQRIWVYQQHQSALGKIKAIEQYSPDEIELRIISIDTALPPVIDDATDILPDPKGADLVLDHLKHPDLSFYLAEKCRRLKIPVVASGKKPPMEEALTPRTCCALTQQEGLGSYGKRYGQPEYRVSVEDGIVRKVETTRGAPCGATWAAAQRIVGLSVETARIRIGLETQFFCVADPSSWDPISGKSPVHIAAELHKAALATALKKADEKTSD